jgi:hypothetical protein
VSGSLGPLAVSLGLLVIIAWLFGSSHRH